ncbi:uncharacterized protein [Periplaneta americana]|uniref:uncharacterized protein isoform X2 n=1 Tax=Periplaneta americana TaxID=6978 RepID=UPI0037E7A3A0
MTTSIRILVLVAVFCVGLQNVADSAHSSTSQMSHLSFSSLASLTRPKREADGEFKQVCWIVEKRNQTKKKEEEESNLEKCKNEIMKKFGIEESELEAEENTKVRNDGAECETFGNYSACIAECVFKKYKVTDINGTIIPDEAIKIIEPPILAESEKFWKAVRNKCSKVKAGIEQNTLCNTAANDYFECVIYFAYLYCPAEKQVKDPICDELTVTLRKKYNEE